MLHIINKSPLTHNTLAMCLRYASASNSLLLIEDGVYGALAQTSSSHLIHSAIANHIQVYALLPDISARGLSKLISGVQTIDYSEFVALVAQHSHTQSWF